MLSKCYARLNVSGIVAALNNVYVLSPRRTLSLSLLDVAFINIEHSGLLLPGALVNQI